MKDCPKCGAPINRGDTACAVCQTRIEGATESFEPVGAETAPTTAEVSSEEGPVLVVRKGPEVGERFYVDRPRLTIGRDPGSDIFLNDVTVSRRHAILNLVGGQVEIEDAGSLNGTYVNGLCVDKAVLANGDTVQIGTFQMVFLRGKGV